MDEDFLQSLVEEMTMEMDDLEFSCPQRVREVLLTLERYDLEQTADKCVKVTATGEDAAPPPCGLANSDYFCYVNAVLQALYACSGFRDSVAKVVAENASPGLREIIPVITAIGKIFHHMTYRDPTLRDTETDTINAIPYLRRVMDLDPQEQEDAEEFMSWLINGLIRECNRISISDIHLDGNNNQTHGSLPRGHITLQRLFSGSLKNFITPQPSNGTPTVERTTSTEPFLTLKLNVGEQISNLYDSMHQYFDVSTVEMGEGTDVTHVLHRTRFEHLPEVLVIQLKIFRYDDEAMHKIMCGITLPETITIPANFLTQTCSDQYPDGSRTYRLQAVVSHFGDTIETGHFICEARHSATEPWYRYNDEIVTPVTLDDVIEPKESPMPYMLFYTLSRTEPVSGAGREPEKFLSTHEENTASGISFL